MPNGEPLPDEIVLSRDEARSVLFALDAGIDATYPDSDGHRQLVDAARIIVDKFLPDLPEL